jgi:hypothetical protein
MTQPRSAQIKSVNTRFSVLSVAVTPGSPETVIPAVSLPAPGGADQDIPARVRGTAVSPYSVLAGDTMSVGLDGAPPVNVVLAATDTTSGRVALKVNAALASAIASNDAGHLVLTSHTVGALSSIVLADVSPGVLSKLGLVAGTYSGIDAPADGVITLSLDGLGGTAPYATEDGKNVVTDGGKLVYFSHVNGFATGRKMMQLVPGGVPVVGKLTFDGTSFHSVYHARLTPRAKVRSFGSFFSLLDGSNTLTLNVNGQGVSVTFSSPAYTRDGVLDAINTAYATAMGISDPWARVDGTAPSPFRGLSGTSFSVEVDGGSPQAVTFSSELTALDVVGRINAVLAGAVASVVSGPNGQYVAIRSSNANGRTSSLKVYSGDQSLFRLGIRPGFYGGTYVADQYGPDEIEIASVFRGSSNGGSPSLSVSGTGTTLVRMGLPSVTLPGSGPAAYEPVPAPFFNAGMSTAAFTALMCFPDVLEFGNVPSDADAVIQQYLAKSAGSNVDERNQAVDDGQSGSMSTLQAGRGFFDVGKPIVTSPDGSVPSADGGGDSVAVDAIVKQITRLSATEVVQAVVGARFETPGAGSNPLPPAPFMDFYADPTNAFTARGFRMHVSPSGFALSVGDDSAGVLPAQRAFVAVEDGRPLLFRANEGRLADANTLAAGENGYLQLSSAGDRFLRLGEAYALPSLVPGYNVLRSVNARGAVYVGDGVNTFGDFNGTSPGVTTDGLSQAVAYLRAAGATRCHIVIKPGSYVELAFVDFTSFVDVVLEGEHAQEHNFSGTNLTITNSSQACLYFPTAMHSLAIRNLNINPTDNTQAVVFAKAAILDIEGCSLFGFVRAGNPVNMCMRRVFQRTGSTSVTIVYDDGGASEVCSLLFEDNDMASAQDFPVIAVFDQTTAIQVTIDQITVQRCTMSPGTATFNGVGATTAARSFVSAYGAGVISFIPSSNAYSTGVFAGVIVSNLDILSTSVSLGLFGTTVNASFVALNILPGGPQAGASWSYGADAAVRLDNVRVEDMSIGFPAGTSFRLQMQSPCVCVGGVGIPPDFGFSFGNTGYGTLTFKRVHVDVEQAIHGPATTNMLQFFNEYSLSSVSNSVQSGLVCLSGQNVVAEDLVFSNTADLCGSPELMAIGYGHLRIRGFETQPVAGYGPQTLLTLPNARLWVRDVYGANISVSDVLMNGAGQSATAWANKGMLVIEGGVGGGLSGLSGGRVNCDVSNFSIQNFFFSFAVPGVAILAPTGHTNWPTSLHGGGVLLDRGYIGNGGSGSPNGFSNGVSAIVLTPATIDNVHVRDVAVDSCQFNGILLSMHSVSNPVSVRNCRVSLCGNVNGAGGIRISSQNTLSTPAAQIVVRDNDSFLNNIPSGSGYDGIQINVRDTGSTHRPTVAAIYNNNCADNANSSYGKINSCVNSNTNFPFSGNYISVFVQCFGVETGYTGQTGSFTSFGNGYIWVSPFKCMHNNAALNTDFSNSQ